MAKIKPYLSLDLKKLKRGPAIIPPKDAGLIIAYTGIGKNSRVAEIGTGSGFLTIQLAKIVKKVITYEKREEFLKIAENNFKLLKLKNIKTKNKDAVISFKEKNLSLVVIDIPNAEEVVEKSYNSLNKDGFMVGHCLSIEQGKKLFLEGKKYFKEVFMLDNTIKYYDVNEQRVREKHIGIMHTSYLVFARK